MLGWSHLRLYETGGFTLQTLAVPYQLLKLTSPSLSGAGKSQHHVRLELVTVTHPSTNHARRRLTSVI